MSMKSSAREDIKSQRSVLSKGILLDPSLEEKAS